MQKKTSQRITDNDLNSCVNSIRNKENLFLSMKVNLCWDAKHLEFFITIENSSFFLFENFCELWRDRIVLLLTIHWERTLINGQREWDSYKDRARVLKRVEYAQTNHDSANCCCAELNYRYVWFWAFFHSKLTICSFF